MTAGRPIPFKYFRVTYRDTVANNIKYIMDITRHKPMNLKRIISCYLGALTYSSIEQGTTFELIQGQPHAVVAINGRHIPIFQGEEALYGYLFEGYLKESYTFQGKWYNIRGSIIREAPLLTKYFHTDQPMGLGTLRNLRYYALIHDYHLGYSEMQSLMGLKTYRWVTPKPDRVIDRLNRKQITALISPATLENI